MTLPGCGQARASCERGISNSVVERRKDFPWLDNRISYLEHRVYATQQKVDDQAFQGKLDAAEQKWLSDTRDELAEFQYIKRVLSPTENRIAVTGYHLLAYAILIAVIVALFWRYFGA